MTDDVHERIGFREIDQDGNAVPAVSPHAPDPAHQAQGLRAVNPFIVALWALDLVLLGFCIWTLNESAQPTATSTAGGGIPWNFLLLSTLPYGLLAFLLLTAALLFWHAAAWQKRRPTR
ncbi:hypothetical protein ACIPY2_16820 [Paenarthrobacter sp. NPDC089675]|uniref:hypothetical protein n=1 Tax=Paenarthrobacter sp. NPDC089675 TaxID=3364376 RepID=UPI003823E1B0